MTLVLGNSGGANAFLVADTLITSPAHGVGLNVSQLKISFPYPHMAVGFAGDPDIAERDVSEFIQLNDGSYHSAKTFFSARAKRSQNDYLISFGATGLILRCRQSGVDRPTGTPWIGDHAAFSAYQAASQPDGRAMVPGPEWTMDLLPAEANAAFKPLSQLRRVIESKSVASVGHFITIAVHSAKGFSFGVHSTTYADRPSVLTDNQGRRTLLSLGVNADYRVVACPPKLPGVSAAVFAFPHANTALLYASPGFNFGRYSRTYKLPLKDALDAAYQETGIEFDLVDVRMSPP